MTGTLRFLPGTQGDGKRYWVDALAGRLEEGSDYERIDESALDTDSRVVSLPARPGDVIAFHGMTLHSASGNSSESEDRISYSLRFAGDDVRPRGQDAVQLGGEEHPPVWVEGQQRPLATLTRTGKSGREGGG